MPFTQIPSISTKTASYQLLTSDDTVVFNASSAALTGTLPDATTCQGRRYTMKKNDSSTNIVAIATLSSQTLDAYRTSANLRRQNDFITVESDGANWQIVNKKETEVVSATGGGNLSTYTNNGYGASGAPVALTPGQWRVTASISLFCPPGSTAAGVIQGTGFYAADGANTTTVPASLSDIQGISGPFNQGVSGRAIGEGGSVDMSMSTASFQAIVGMTASGSVYFVPRVSFTTASSANVTVVIQAERIW